jgi:hypothetical protein
MKFMMLRKYRDTSLKHIRNLTAYFPDKVQWWIDLSVIKLQGSYKALKLMASYRNIKLPTSSDRTDSRVGGTTAKG